MQNLKLQIAAYESALRALTPWLTPQAALEALDVLAIERAMATTPAGRAAADAACEVLRQAASQTAPVTEIWRRRGWSD